MPASGSSRARIWPTWSARSGSTTACSKPTFPHPTSLYPFDNVEARLEGMTYEERAKVLSLNASKLYNIAV